jgi:hypothetical protein
MTHIDMGDLYAYMEGALTGDSEPERKRIEEHLAGCEDCTRTLEEEKKLAQFVSKALSVEVPTHVLDSLPTAGELRALAETNAPSVTPITEAVKTQDKRRRRKAAFLPKWWVLQPQWQQVAALLVLFVGGAYVVINKQGTPPSVIPALVGPSTPQVRSPAGVTPAVAADAPAMEKGLPATDGDLPFLEIRTGETILGSLEAGDEVLGDGSFADPWIYRARAGRTVIIDLLSIDFDAYLFIGNEAADILAEDDDSGEGMNSRISFTPTESASYGIVVNSYDSTGRGQYALSVTLEDPDAESAGRAPDLSEPDWENLYPGNGDPNDRYALIVGIADYPGSDADLIGPDVDAQQFRGLLTDEFGFQDRNIVTLTDSEATRDHIIQAFSRHLGQAGPDGLAVFFYSGHGTQLEENFGLAGVYDPEPDGRDEAILVWGSTEYANISDDELGILADRLEANRTLIVLDACHTGTGTRSAASDGRQPKWTNLEDIEQSLERREEYLTGRISPLSTSSGFFLSRTSPFPLPTSAEDTPVISVGSTSIEVSDPMRHVLLAASADEEKAYTDPEFGYGVFTRMLVEEMRNASTLTTFDEMMARVQQRTLERTEGDQTPQTEGQLSSSRIREFLSRNR